MKLESVPIGTLYEIRTNDHTQRVLVNNVVELAGILTDRLGLAVQLADQMAPILHTLRATISAADWTVRWVGPVTLSAEPVTRTTTSRARSSRKNARKIMPHAKVTRSGEKGAERAAADEPLFNPILPDPETSK